MRHYSTEQLFSDTQKAGKELLLIAEWIIVVVAFSWAAERAQSFALYYFSLLLNLALAMYITVCVNRLIWGFFPGVGPNKTRGWRTTVAAATALAIAFGAFSLVDASFNALMCVESVTTRQVNCGADGVGERTLYPKWLSALSIRPSLF